MKSNIEVKDVDVVILCGGKGERLKSVINDCPKPMADINGSPFLDILIDYVASFGFRRFILCTGFMGGTIKRYYQKRKDPLEVLFSEEKEALGTAGAIKNAETIIRSNPFLVLNGDSFCRIDLKEFIDFYFAKKAMFSVVLVKGAKGSRKQCGVVKIGALQQVIRFDEKVEIVGSSFFNAGIYLFERSIFSMIPSNKNFSFEYDLFPKIIDRPFYGFVSEEEMVDIGTPQR